MTLTLTLIVNEKIARRLHEAFVEVFPGPVLCLSTVAVPSCGLANGSDRQFCVGAELGRRMKLQGWRDRLILTVTRQEFGEMRLMLGPRDSLLFHDVSPDLLRASVRLAMEGLTVFPGELVPRNAIVGPQLRGFRHLGPDDRAVMAELALGFSNRQIAARLGRQVDSVRMSVDRILRSLDCRNRTEVAVLAYGRLSGFLELPELLPPRRVEKAEA